MAASPKIATRNSTDHLAFGQPANLPMNLLPTELDIAKSFLHEKQKWMIENSAKKEPDNSIIAEIVVSKVESVYKRASIPIVRKDVIKARVLKVYEKRQSIARIPVAKRYNNPKCPNLCEFSDFFKKKKEMFKKEISCLFEIADNAIVPKSESEFLIDQRTKRKMTISSKVDKESTRKQHLRESIKKAEEARAARERQRRKTQFQSVAALSIEDADEDEAIEEDSAACSEYNSDSNFQVVPSTSTSSPAGVFNISLKNRGRDLREIAKAKVRNLISDRATASIVNATLRTYSIPEIIDKSKLRRAVKTTFEEAEAAKIVFCGGFCYDGRKDITLMQEKVHGKYYTSKKTEEHITIVSLPDEVFLGHVSPPDGKAITVSNSLIQFLQEKNIIDAIEALACDGTNTNVGAEGGINHLLEVSIGRALQWNICLLHANELPLRHLILELDGPTTGANTFAGPIGKLLPDVMNYSVTRYKRFNRSQPLDEMPVNVWKDLSTDQKYMWKITSALISGQFDEELQRLKIGPCNHSRWLTTACRICRLYACTTEPSEVLNTLTSYIVNVYAPMWFTVKYHELAINGPQNLFFLMKRSKLMEDEAAKEIVQRCIQRNAFYAHPENILLAELASSHKPDRKDAVTTIIEARKKNQGVASSVRLFRVPPLDFKATKWQLMIKWSETDTLEPPLIRNMSNSDLLAVVREPLIVPKFKCHIQMVERAVKEVTKASVKVIGIKRRDATIKTLMENRTKYPKQESKKDFVPT